jgi:DNA adenine methylase
MYMHEMTDEDHRTLAEALKQVKGMVLMSGYPSDLYKELYSDWQLVTMQTINNAGKPATECLWLSPAAAARQRQLRMEFA